MTTLKVEAERFPIAGRFVISRGARTEAEIVRVVLTHDGVSGTGECVPYGRYGETVAGVLETIEALRGAIGNGLDRQGLQIALKPGAARNALDCAFWDLEIKSGAAVLPLPETVATAFTVSLGSPADMAQGARRYAGHALVKLKLDGDVVEERIAAVRAVLPGTTLIVDANEAWAQKDLEANFAACARHGIALVEQPLPAGADAILAQIDRPVPLCADESAHGLEGLDALVGRYDAINVKLDKTGGLTEAFAVCEGARALGLDIMVGCMVGTSLGIAPALRLADRARWCDLDGPFLLARDRTPGLRQVGGIIDTTRGPDWGR